MAITLQDLTVNFDHLDRARLLDDWTWLIGPLKVPILLSAAGDAFLQDAGDGSVLGGEYAIENFEKSDIEVHFSLLGHIHEKVKDLPPGTSIDSIRIT